MRQGGGSCFWRNAVFHLDASTGFDRWQTEFDELHRPCKRTMVRPVLSPHKRGQLYQLADLFHLLGLTHLNIVQQMAT